MSIAGFVESSLRALQGQQLITGEIASYGSIEDGLSCYLPRPLWSALVYDALSYLDPDSRAFERSVVDLFPPAKYRVISATVWTLRWRLRTYLAWEEEADGTWRKAGRHSSSPADALTTACAALALLSPGSMRRPAARRHLGALRHWLSTGAWDQAARAQTLRYFSLAGADTCELTEAAWEDCRSESQDAMSWYAIGRAWHDARLPGHSQIADLIVPRILSTRRSDRAEMALKMSSLLDLGYTGPLLKEMFRSTLTAPLYANCDFSMTDQAPCPGATIALALSNVVRASMGIAGRRLD